GKIQRRVKLQLIGGPVLDDRQYVSRQEIDVSRAVETHAGEIDDVARDQTADYVGRHGSAIVDLQGATRAHERDRRAAGRSTNVELEGAAPDDRSDGGAAWRDIFEAAAAERRSARCTASKDIQDAAVEHDIAHVCLAGGNV